MTGKALEAVLKLITAPVWVPIYFGYLGCRKLAEGWAKKAEAGEGRPHSGLDAARDFERAVFAALILAGEPVNNRRLAELMGCSSGRGIKRVAQARRSDPQGPQRP